MSKTRRSSRSEAHADRYTLVRRAVLGLDYWLYGSVRLLPLCDYIKILLFEPDPLIVTIWKRTEVGWERVFSTHKDFPIRFSERAAAIASNSSLAILCAKIKRGRAVVFSTARPKLTRLLAHEHVQTIGEQVSVLARENTKPAAMPGPSRFRRRETSEQPMDYWPIFDGVYSVLGKSPRFSFLDPLIANLFGFVFVADDHLTATEGTAESYTPVCVLSPQQKERFSALKGAETESVADTFRRFFGREARAAFDTGSIVLAEPLINDERSGPSIPKALNAPALRHRLYIPIHIEGVAWIVLLRFLDGEEHDRWYEVFHFYHDVVPRIGAMLRTKSKAVYLGMLENVLTEEITRNDPATFAQRCNERFIALDGQFPFAGMRIVEGLSIGPLYPFPENRTLSFQIERSRSFESPVDYDPLDAQSITQACENAVRRAHKAEEMFDLELDYQTHTFVNELPNSQLEAALSRGSAELSGLARDFVETAMRKMALLATTLSIPFHERELSYLADVHTLFDLLRWLRNTASSSNDAPDLILPDSSLDVPLDTRAIKADAFTLMWNAWHNAGKKYVTTTNRWQVSAAIENAHLAITFRNAGEMSDRYRFYMNSMTAPWPGPDDKMGLRIIKSKILSLGWPAPLVEVEDGVTRLKLFVDSVKVQRPMNP